MSWSLPKTLLNKDFVVSCSLFSFLDTESFGQVTSLATIQRTKSRPCWTSTSVISLWARRACLLCWALSRMWGGSALSWWSSAARFGIWSDALRTPGSSHHASRTPALQQRVSDRKFAALQSSAGSLLRHSAPPLHTFTTAPTWSSP